MEKSFQSVLHPRDKHDRFAEKGVMELSEEERNKLLDYLEAEEYIPFCGFHVSANKIKAVYAGLYSEEVYACKILVQNGFDIYLLDEKYVGGKKADAFFKKGGRRDFLELKHTKDKKITGLYNDSIEQAPNCFIVIDGYMSKVQKKNLNDAVYKNDKSKEVYVYLKRTGEFIKIK
ncbi:MAG: hypothetical protein IKP60_08040 [Treponema sp.]|nr:hypothetical protein [Treponema sp.]